MSEKNDYLLAHLTDLANQSYNQNIYTFSDFLGLSEQSMFLGLQKQIDFVRATSFGGGVENERVMIRFGDKESLGYEQDFPIDCLQVKPLMEKYSENLTHRDYLGALMNLGIERSLLGDILIKEKIAYLFCKDSITEYISENLNKVRHTSVITSLYEGDSIDIKPSLVPKSIQVSSIRIDAIVAKVFGMSRDKSLDLFRSGKVFINGKEITQNSLKPKNYDIISVRGYGRVRFLGESKVTKKGNLVLDLEMFV